MFKCYFLIAAYTSLFVCHSALSSSEPIGWHWYNEVVSEKNKENENRELQNFKQLSSSDQLKVLQEATNELKARAVLSGNVHDVTAYKRAQDFWVNKASLFSVSWERMLLENPSLDYSLRFPNENSLAPVSQQGEEMREYKKINNMSRWLGMLFFYRDKNKGDKMMSRTISRYANEHHFYLIKSSVDEKEGLDKASKIGVHYFPAVVLVNPKTKQSQVVSYGFKSEKEIDDRLYKIATHWKPRF